MQETKITKGRIRNHFTYSWWKYLLLACAAIFGWNLIYTSTAYSPPKDKRFDIYFVTHGISEETLSWFEDDILARYPEVEDAQASSVVYTDEDNYYGAIQLTTYMGAAEGDIYLLTRERFEAYAPSGGFMPLDDVIASGALDIRDVDVARGTMTDEEDGERKVYGIPLDSLYGLMEYGIDNRDLVACVMAYSVNPERSIDWLNWLVEAMKAPKPEWLVEQEASSGVTVETDDIPSY